MDTISNELAGMLFGNEGLMKSFNKDSYADAFNEYYEKYSYVFDEIDSGFAQSENGEAYLKSLAEGFINTWSHGVVKVWDGLTTMLFILISLQNNCSQSSVRANRLWGA